MNKQLLITGATKGIGKAILFQFASQGFDIVTCARCKEDLEHLKSDFEANYPNQKIHVFKADLSVKAERNTFSKTISKYTLDVLINNAGLYVPGKVHLEEDGVLEQMIETNLYSAYDVTRAIVPQMIKSKSGLIFNICSTASIVPYINGGSYCISKFAMLGFSKVLREELKEYGIKVTSVLPGPTFTSSWEGSDIPEARFMSAEDIAQSIWSIYQLSDRTVVEEIVLRPQLGDL